jgi:hypothetical protein
MNDPGIFAEPLNRTRQMQRILRCYDAAKRENRCSAVGSFWIRGGRRARKFIQYWESKIERPGAMRPGVFYLGDKMPDAPHYRTEEEIEDVVSRFEDCSYTPEEFVHARHLTVAAWCFATMQSEAAREKMRAGLRRFIAHHGKNGYHVTITEFWLEKVGQLVAELREGKEGLVPLVNSVVERCSDKNLIYEFYSRERIASPEAKLAWIAPDTKLRI